jgi:hypothetical protein
MEKVIIFPGVALQCFLNFIDNVLRGLHITHVEVQFIDGILDILVALDLRDFCGGGEVPAPTTIISKFMSRWEFFRRAL